MDDALATSYALSEGLLKASSTDTDNRQCRAKQARRPGRPGCSGQLKMKYSAKRPKGSSPAKFSTKPGQFFLPGFRGDFALYLKRTKTPLNRRSVGLYMRFAKVM